MAEARQQIVPKCPRCGGPGDFADGSYGQIQLARGSASSSGMDLEEYLEVCGLCADCSDEVWLVAKAAIEKEVAGG